MGNVVCRGFGLHKKKKLAAKYKKTKWDIRSVRWPPGVTCSRCSTNQVTVYWAVRTELLCSVCLWTLQSLSTTDGSFFVFRFLLIDRWVCESSAGSLRGSDPAVDGSDPAVDGSAEAEVTDTTVFLLFIHIVKLTSLNVSFCPKRLSLRHKHLHHHQEGFHITDSLHHDHIRAEDINMSECDDDDVPSSSPKTDVPVIKQQMFFRTTQNYTNWFISFNEWASGRPRAL